MEFEIRVPDLGTTDDEMELVRWLVSEGQPVKLGQPLLEVETDKATMEVESIAAGTLKQIIADTGTEITTGQVIAIVEGDGQTAWVSGPTASAGAQSPPPELSSSPAVRPHPVTTADQPCGDVPAENIGRYNRDFLLALYERMSLIRVFEERVKLLFLEGSMPGTIHQCQGQEACAVGVCAALRDNDFITSTFRGDGHALAKGLTPDEVLFELYGAVTGCCRGKGGSMHLGNFNKGMIPGIAIVGGSVPLATGMALAFKMQNTSQVVSCFFGDGAVAEGAFHEGINLAAIWNLPAIFVCENNHYGASTRVDKVMKVHRIADRASSYGVSGHTIDGNNILAGYEAARRAADQCRRGDGPVLLELLTYRRTGHSRRDACHYQPEEEREYWLSRDPIQLLGRRLLERDDVTEGQLEEIGTQVNKQFDDAHSAASRQPMPTDDELTSDVFS